MDTMYVHVCIQIYIHTCTYVGIHISKYSPSKSCLEEIANYDIALHCSTVFVFDSTLADPIKYVLPCFSLVLNFLKKPLVFFSLLVFFNTNLILTIQHTENRIIQLGASRSEVMRVKPRSVIHFYLYIYCFLYHSVEQRVPIYLGTLKL